MKFKANLFPTTPITNDAFTLAAAPRCGGRGIGGGGMGPRSHTATLFLFLLVRLQLASSHTEVKGNEPDPTRGLSKYTFSLLSFNTARCQNLAEKVIAQLPPLPDPFLLALD